MSTVLLIVQLVISIILTGLILIQQSEGGALGIGGGGGGGGGGFMSGRSAASSVGRATAILGTLFILNCLVLSIVFNKENQEISLIDDTQAIESLTTTSDSVDESVPLADDTTVLQTETGDLITEPAISPETTDDSATDTTEDKPESE